MSRVGGTEFGVEGGRFRVYGLGIGFWEERSVTVSDVIYTLNSKFELSFVFKAISGKLLNQYQNL